MTPSQRRRLNEIATNLEERIEKAKANGWLGEVQGLQVSLKAARSKLASLDRNPFPPQPVNLGIPIIQDEPRP